MKKILLFTLAFCSLGSVNAQFGKKAAQRYIDKKFNSEEANARFQALKTRILLVTLDSKDEEYNNNIKKVVEEYYKYDNAGIEYLTGKELKAIKKSQYEKYSLLRLEKNVAHTSRAGIGMGANRVKTQTSYYMLNLKLLEDAKSFTKTFWSANVPKKPSMNDLVVAVSEINNVIMNKADGKDIATNINSDEAKENTKAFFDKAKDRLAKRTLVISKATISKKIDREFIKSIYPYDFKIISEEEMENLRFSDKKSKYALVAVQNKMAVILSMEDNYIMTRPQPMGTMAPISGRVANTSVNNNPSIEIDKKSLKKLLEKI